LCGDNAAAAAADDDDDDKEEEVVAPKDTVSFANTSTSIRNGNNTAAYLSQAILPFSPSLNVGFLDSLSPSLESPRKRV
jgi:hypothetical protein